MSRRIALLGCVLLAACGGGSDATASKVLTTLTVTLTPNAIQVGQSSVATATGVDQNGASMPTGTVTWSSGATNATVSQGGTVTAVGPGTAIITGTVGSKSAQAVLTIVPMPAVAMTFATAMPSTMVNNHFAINPAPVVQLVNAVGAPVGQAGVTVTTAASVGTLLGTTTATTDANGRATFSTFGVGGALGARNIVFSAPGMTNLSTSVTLTLGPPAFGLILAGNNQSAAAGSNVAIAPSLQVTDPDGNVIPNLPMDFIVEVGGGSVVGSPVTTDANGTATIGSWKLGPTPGNNVLFVRPVGSTSTTGPRFTATGTAALKAVGPAN